MRKNWRKLSELITIDPLWYMQPIEPTIPDDPEDPGPGGDPPPGSLPGLAGNLRPRYTSNLAVVEQIPVIDLLHEVIFPSMRGYMTQGANGKIRLHNKKPVDWALGTAAFPVGDTILDVDDVSAWVSDLKYYLLIDPHTNDSEIRSVTDANYPTSQNSTTLTTSHTGTAFTVTGFSGADGNNTPATASITVNSFTAATTYTVTIDGTDIQFIPSSGDTVASISSFLAGALRGHPNIARKFRIEWDGVDTVDFTALFGTLTVNAPLTLAHVAPEANPTAAPTLTAAAGSLPAGDYKVAYAYRNEHGQTLLSPFKNITLAASEQITISAVTPPAGLTVVWYVVPEANSTKLRYHSENDGSSFVLDDITDLPLLSAPLPPDLNRTGTEVMRIKAVFSDRAETRSSTVRSNVLKATFDWDLGNRQKTVNRVDLEYRDSSQDYRRVELRVRNDAHIAKIKKTEPFAINGQAIDNYFQAYRIAAGELAVRRDADFFYKWSATREAHLLEEFDVVAITDASSGVVNFPVSIEDIEIDPSSAGLPKLSFVGKKFANSYYDDSVNEIEIPIITEVESPEEPPPSPPAWSPADLAQAVARYSWSEMVGFADNDPVGTWVDTIGSFDATGSSTARPLYKSAGYVSFDGINDILNTGITTAFTDFAVFAVFRMINQTGLGVRVVDKTYNTGFWVGSDTTGSGNLGGGIMQTGAPYGDFYTASASTWYAMLYQRSGTTKTIRFAGVSNTAAVSGSACDTSSLYIGGTGALASFGQIDVKEIVICNDDISGGDLTDLIAYAASEYGLTL